MKPDKQTETGFGGPELLTTDEMANADRLTIESGTPGEVLMENAGRGIADHILMRFPDRQRIGILCGPGNNGGDGFVAARLLKAAGRDIELALLGTRERLTGDAALMAGRWGGEIRPLEPGAGKDCDLIIDAIFGAGLVRPIEGDLAGVVEAANNSAAPIVAVDVPSGIDGSSGECRGAAIQATTTVTFFRCKPGHYLFPGRAHCGEVTCIDIGISPGVLERINPKIHLNCPAFWGGLFPRPRQDGHKYNRGHCLVVSGPVNSTGAARLAARAALRAGAGLVTVASPPDAVTVNASQLTAVMVHEFATSSDLADILADERKNAVVIGPGCGAGPSTAEKVLTILKTAAGAVLDADALTSFSGQADLLFETISSRQSPVILTPHEGEFARLFGERIAPGPKTGRAVEAARLSGATVILKGADTVIAAPDGRAAINATGTPWLATAGSGDVLGGIAGGLVAQHMPGFESACAAVWLHGRTGELAGPGLIAEDLSELLPRVLAEMAG